MGATFDGYASWGGKLESDAFSALLPRAESLVRQRLAAIDPASFTQEEGEARDRAVYAAVEALGDDQSGLASYSAGKVSVKFADSAYRSNTVGAAIERELSGSRLVGTAV